jgi:hypothetical protein
VNELGLIVIIDRFYHGQKLPQRDRRKAVKRWREARASELQAIREPQKSAPFCGVWWRCVRGSNCIRRISTVAPHFRSFEHVTKVRSSPPLYKLCTFLSAQ